MKRTLIFFLALALAGCIKRPQELADSHPHLAFKDQAKTEPTPSSTKRPSSDEEWGEEFFKKGDYRRAVAYLSEAVKKNQSSAKLWRNLGSAYALAEDYDNSVLCYERALKRNPNDLQTYYNLSLVHNFKGSSDELKKAEEAATHGLNIDPNQAPLHSSLGNIYADEGKDDSALKEYERAIAINPKDPVTRFNDGALHFKRKEIKAAETEYRETLKLDPKDSEAARIWRRFISSKTGLMTLKNSIAGSFVSGPRTKIRLKTLILTWVSSMTGKTSWNRP